MRSQTALCGAVALLMCSMAAAQSSTVVKTLNGPVMGAVSGKATFWKGIPFAAPPMGNNRWRPPQPVTPWQQPLNASQFRDACPQLNAHGYGMFGMSEDCLYLNVYRPTTMPAGVTKLPVMFFIYGGSWTSGSSSYIVYDGTNDALRTNSVVVTINYRLGALGWAGADQLRSRSPNNSTGMYGFLDQRAAMQWVQDNIGFFGGDKNSVMVFGESAGAASTSTHLVTPKSWPLFTNAGMESGPIAPWIAKSMPIAQKDFLLVSRAAGCTESSDVTNCMLKLPWQDIVAAQMNATGGNGAPAYGPVIDGVELPYHPVAIAAMGGVAPKSVLLGTNANESTLFLLDQIGIPEAGVAAYVEHTVPNSTLAAAVMAAYPASDFPNPWTQLVAIATDSGFTCPTRFTARAFAQRSGLGAAYLYHFTHVPSFSKPPLACAHSFELPFVFGTPSSYLMGKGEQALSNSMVNYWGQFAQRGDPNVNGEVHWPPYTANTDQNIVLDMPISTQSGLHKKRCDLWDAIFASLL